jgi:probable F420-dependent oxidoreductase
VTYMHPTDGSIGLSCFGLAADETVAIAKFAEEVGFDGLWLGEHALTPATYGSEHPYFSESQPIAVVDRDTPLADVWGTFGAIAAVTSHFYLATGVFILPLRHPLATALAADTLQSISHGRFIFGVGSGWLAEEFAALDQGFKNRGSRMDEIVTILRAAWKGGPFSFDGEHYKFDPVIIRTGPVDIPMIYGGLTERALLRAAVHGDGWYNPSSAGLDECVSVRNRLSALLEQVERSANNFQFHIRVMDPTPRSVDTFRSAGFNYLSVSTQRMWSTPTEVPLSQKLADVERLSKELGL